MLAIIWNNALYNSSGLGLDKNHLCKSPSANSSKNITHKFYGKTLSDFSSALLEHLDSGDAKASNSLNAVGLKEKSDNDPAAGAMEDKANCRPEWRQSGKTTLSARSRNHWRTGVETERRKRRESGKPLMHRSEDRVTKRGPKEKTPH